MHKGFIALGLALSILPVAALADDTSGPPGPPPSPPTAAQRQAMLQTFTKFRQQEEHLHAQMRTQMLASLTATHRAAIANLIGQLAISTNPQPETVARQIDALLSQGEQQRILAAHASYRQQTEALHQQMRAQLASEFPAMAQRAAKMRDDHGQMSGQWSENHQEHNDAGSVLLRTLARPDDKMMIVMGHGMGGPGPGVMHEGGAPPQP
jgi:hypothetical protein